MKAHWQKEKETIGRIREIKQKIEEARIEEQAAERAGDLGRAAELRYGVQLSLQNELDRANKEIAELQKEQRFLYGSKSII